MEVSCLAAAAAGLRDKGAAHKGSRDADE